MLRVGYAGCSVYHTTHDTDSILAISLSDWSNKVIGEWSHVARRMVCNKGLQRSSRISRG
jgi:hypothetical protein